MSEIIEFEIQIPPQPKERPRFMRTRGSGVRVFTTKATRNYESCLAALARPHAPESPWADCPLKLTCVFHLNKPQKVRKYPHCRPDLDNYLKAVMDSFNGIMWKDDAQVIDLSAKKIYCEVEPKIYVKIEKIEDI